MKHKQGEQEHTHTQRETQKYRERDRHSEREKYMERHRHRHTETCKLRGTHILRQTPSSKKGHTLLRLKYAHTHTH